MIRPSGAPSSGSALEVRDDHVAVGVDRYPGRRAEQPARTNHCLHARDGMDAEDRPAQGMLSTTKNSPFAATAMPRGETSAPPEDTVA